MKFLVINGHKYYPFAKGELNRTLFNKIVDVVSPNNEIDTTIVEEGYDLKTEVDKFLSSDIIIIQTPINWFSFPGVFKSYIDDVYKHGSFYGPSDRYGRGGLLHNKRYMYSLTMNAPKQAFESTDGFYDFRAPDDAFIAMHKLQQYCGLEKIKTFCCFDVVKNPDVPRYLTDLENHLNKYVLPLTT